MNDNSNANVEEHREDLLEILDEMNETLKEDGYTPSEIVDILKELHDTVGIDDVEAENNRFDDLPESIRDLAEDAYGYWYLLQPVGGSNEVERIINEYRDEKLRLIKIKQQQANIALSLGQSKLPANIVKKISNLTTGPLKKENTINYVNRAHRLLSKKQPKPINTYKNMFKTKNAGKKPSRCVGLGCSIMGGKRKSKTRKNKKSKSSKKH